MRKDVIDIIEAAYRHENDDQRWFDGILDAAHSIGRCYGHVIARESVQGPVTSTAYGSHDTNVAERLPAVVDMALSVHASSMSWAHHMPAPPVEHASHRERRIARHFATDSRWLQELVPADAVGSSMYNSVGVLAGDAAGRRAMVLGLLDRPPPSPREAALLSRLSAHLTAAVRMRDAATPDDAAAVIDTRGRVLEAVAEAAPRRKSLVEAAKSMDRSRGRLRRTSPEEALSLWRAMVDGRWSLVDFVDRDGKRMILARENHPAVRDVQALTPIERSVIGYAALGHSNKHLGYELGLAPSTVASHLARALKKLRLTSRRELIERFGPLVVQPE